ncbi:MAG: RNA polymerase factor sigma-32 [Deltaproteobacteria bacterium]|nr:RNA polymerase factor sigma-32 [Deltaproteobacteria bacterium]MBW2121759.1 RNA polymerase factor sigma-32 [Deltaproteobacteria bacterium]
MKAEGLTTIEKPESFDETDRESLREIHPPARFDPLQRYLAEVRSYPILDAEEEKALAIRYREKGDIEAAYKLVVSNLRLVVKIALEYYNSWMASLLDLIQEGNIGLMLAVKKFDPYRGVRLPHYASFWIRAYILRFIMENWRLVKVGTTQAQRKLFFNLRKEKERLEALGYTPGPKLLARNLDVKESEVIDMDQRLGSREISLDAPVEQDSGTSFGDLLPAEEVYLDERMANEELRTLFNEKIEAFRKTLKGRDLDIFENRILASIPATLHEMGNKYGISHERVRQIEKNIIKRFKAFVAKEIPDLAEDRDSLNLSLP